MQGRDVLPASLSAAVYESVTAALYLDGGVVAARDFVMRTMEETIVAASESGHQQNFKSVLQQHAQTHGLESPQYTLLEERGPDHAKTFLVEVSVGGRRFEACWARSKKRAEQLSALAALEELGLIVRNGSGKPVYVPADAGGDRGEVGEAV
jgi:ribonuclease-3